MKMHRKICVVFSNFNNKIIHLAKKYFDKKFQTVIVDQTLRIKVLENKIVP